MQGLGGAPWIMPNMQGSHGASDCGTEVTAAELSAEGWHESYMQGEKALNFPLQFTLEVAAG